MGHSFEASGLQTQLNQGAIALAGWVHNSFQQVQGLQSFGAGFSQQLMLGCCLSAKQKYAEMDIDQSPKLKFRNLKKILTFGNFKPIVLIIGEGKESQDQEKERYHPQEYTSGKTQAVLLWSPLTCETMIQVL